MQKTKRRRPPPFKIDRLRRESLTSQITEGLRHAIMTGYYRAGEALPMRRELARHFGVSIIVTSAVIRTLGEEGLIRARPHIGSVVVPKGAKIWRGHVLLVLPDVPGAYYANVLGDELSEHLANADYSLTRITVLKGKDGKYDFSGLDLELRRTVNLTVLLGNIPSPEIERHLSESGAPFVLVGDKKCKLPGCVGNLRYFREAAVPEFMRHCRAAGVKTVLQAGRDKKDLNTLPAFRRAGIRVTRLPIPLSPFFERHESRQRNAMEIFDARLAKGRDWFPDLILFTDDIIAAGAFLALVRHGVKIPEDVKVVSWANRGFGPVFFKSLTCMEMDPRAHGAAIAQYVCSYLKKGGTPVDMRIGPVYRVGETFP